MTEQQKSIWRILRIAGPVVMFFIVLFALNYLLALPLVLAVVIACLFAIVEFVILTWLIRRTENG